MNRLPTSDSWTTKIRQITPQPNNHQNALNASLAHHAFFLPARYEQHYKYPLIVWLHDDGGSERQVSQVIPHMSVQNYVSVGVRGTRALDATGHRFEWPQSAVGFAMAQRMVLEAVDAAIQRCSIHCDRIFLAGYRSGGTMAQRIALRCPQRFAGAISLGGYFPRGACPLVNWQAARSVPLLTGLATEASSFSDLQLAEDLKLARVAKLRLEVQKYDVEDEMMVSILQRVNHWVMNIVTGRSAAKYIPVCDTKPVEFSAN